MTALDSREITVADAMTLQHEAAERSIMLMWTVTTGTKDFGERYVARPHQINREVYGPVHSHLIADTLEGIREQLRQLYLVQLSRDPKDDPVIVEIWV